jgi:Fanconi anemia group M protein
MVATSVGEEGLDIPSTELVVFFEPVASEIRTIQRRGRTGRKMPGRVVILMAKGTRDEAYRWAAFNKERRMMAELDMLRRKLAGSIAVGIPGPPDMGSDFRMADMTPAQEDVLDETERVAALEPSRGSRQVQSACREEEPVVEAPKKRSEPSGHPADVSGEIDEAVRRRAIEILEGTGPSGDSALTEKTVRAVEPAPAPRGQLRLGDFPPDKDEPLTVIVDHREFSSGVVRELSRNGARVVPMQLPVADFILSERVGVERKEVHDFVGSLLEGRLFQQLKGLRGAYIRPLLVIEGEGLLGISGVGQEAIMGALASIVAGFGIPIISTKDDRETASLLLAIAKREHDEGRVPAVRGDKGSMSLPERQQFIVEGLPHVSGTLSQRLLAELGSVRGVFNATVEQLIAVKGVGRRTAEEIVRTLQSEYLAEAKKERGRAPVEREQDEAKEEE